MKFITGFFMAWGNFLTLPCPYKKWDSRLNSMMLAFLPSVGMVIGGLWCGVFWLLNRVQVSEQIAWFAMILYIFGVCGFMHMDGFMDCNDAILSRKPLEDRQRILKDSTVGAFAVVTVALLLMGWYAAVSGAYDRLCWETLLVIPVASRSMAGLGVLSYKPIGHSQYAKDYQSPGRGKYKAAVIIQMIIVVGFIALTGDVERILRCLSVVVVAAAFSLMYAVRQLGGMSGDIAGYTICVSELAGMLALAIK